MWLLWPANRSGVNYTYGSPFRRNKVESLVKRLVVGGVYFYVRYRERNLNVACDRKEVEISEIVILRNMLHYYIM